MSSPQVHISIVPRPCDTSENSIVPTRASFTSDIVGFVDVRNPEQEGILLWHSVKEPGSNSRRFSRPVMAEETRGWVWRIDVWRFGDICAEDSWESNFQPGLVNAHQVQLSYHIGHKHSMSVPVWDHRHLPALPAHVLPSQVARVAFLANYIGEPYEHSMEIQMMHCGNCENNKKEDSTFKEAIVLSQKERLVDLFCQVK